MVSCVLLAQLVQICILLHFIHLYNKHLAATMSTTNGSCCHGKGCIYAAPKSYWPEEVKPCLCIDTLIGAVRVEGAASTSYRCCRRFARGV